MVLPLIALGSNNTAELSALGEAMLWLRDHCAGVLNQLGLGEVIIDVQVCRSVRLDKLSNECLNM